MSNSSDNKQAGKGSKPRNIFSKNWQVNYPQIDWTKRTPKIVKKDK